MSELHRFQLFIDNEFTAAQGGGWFESDNPFTGKPWALVASGEATDVDRAVRSADKAFRSPEWSSLTATKRGALLRKFADLLALHAEELAIAETRDNGKLITEMRAQMSYLPQWYHYYAGLADKVEGALIPSDKVNMVNFTRYEPLGVIAAIVPWNSPLLLTAWKLAPALAAGNTVVIKPSEFTSTSIARFMEIAREAGFPPGVINVVTGAGPVVGQALVNHALVRKIAFTGGEAAGIAIAEAAARRLVPVTLELGGKSANIVFPDANLDNAVKGVIGGIFAASGQTCVAGSRLLVHRSIADDFVEAVLTMAKSAKLGDPLLPTTEVGPVTTRQQLERILRYIDIGKAEGARCLLGGKRATADQCRTGWFIEPTVFADVTPQMRIAQEEIFGPVLSVIPFDTDEEAAWIANDTQYGLAAGLWTRDLTRAHKMAQKLEAGSVWVNTYRTSAPMSPFGGYKRSGLGREGGAEAIKHYLQVKSVWVDLNDAYPSPFTMRL